MDTQTITEGQRLFEQTVMLRRRNQQLAAENTRLRRELGRARQQIARLKFLLRRTL
jgi:hypothetical protein